MKESRIDYEKVVEMIVFCRDWDEKEEILKRAVRRLVDLETIEKMNNELKTEQQYDTESK